MNIRIVEAQPEDIESVANIEHEIEGANAASIITLQKRREMFPLGFLIAKNEQGTILGYIESVLWDTDKEFETFNEISDFPNHHIHGGKNLYIIFIGVKEEFRKNGIATKLMQELTTRAITQHCLIQSLVAKEYLVSFYSKRGFITVKELPLFLEGISYRSILMNKNLR